MIAIDDNFKISENGGTGNATIFVSATDKNLFSTASTQVEVSTSVGGNIKRYVTLNKKAAHGYMYTPVEWVSNENINLGTIDLGYIIKTNTRMQFKVDYVTKIGDCLIGEENTNSTNNYKWFSVGNYMYYDINTQRLQPTWSATLGEFELGNYYIKDLATGSNMASTNSWSGTRTSTLRIFAPRSQGEDKGRFYYFKIYEGDTLVRDLIPVLDKDNIPCFFDKVGEQFYYYKVNGVPSTGLTAGNVAYYTSDYIEGDGSDYIDIGYVPVANTYIEMDNQTDSILTCGSFDDQRYGLYWQWGNDTVGNWRYSSNAKQINYTSLPSTRYTVKFGKEYYIDGVWKGSFSSSWYGVSLSVTVFGLHRPSDVTERTAGKLYGLKIYVGDILVREYIPYKQYGVVGLYEKINGIFYPSNSNTMTQGGNIQPVVEKVVYDEEDITINNNTPSTAITYGNTFSLGASTTPTGATLSYSSSDTSIATVDNSGVVTAVGKGNATITITAQGFNDDVNKVHYNTTSKTVSVECAYPTQQIVITNSTPSEAINPNDTFDLNASTTPTGITLTYSSSDTSVATVNSNGVITGVATGTTTITISAQGFDDDINHITYTSASTTVSLTVGEVSFNPLTDSGYFVVKALSNTKVAFAGNNQNPTIQYRINGASSWHHLYIFDDPEYDDEYFSIALNEGDYAEIKGGITNDYERNPSTTLSDISLTFYCNTPNSIEIGGYLTALNQNEEINQTNNEVTVSYQYRNLFSGCTGLVSAQYLKLSDNTTNYCYQYLFNRCFNLVTPPQQIQVSNLAESALLRMFYYCTSLASVPVLPATHIGPASYGAMFGRCESLTTVSLLSPRTFDSQACRQMFIGCTNLTSLSMGFSEYDSSTQALYEILKNVTTTGTFYCPSNATYSASDLGLPSTWTLSKTL